MGVKRPFDEETVQELSFKQAKQLDEDIKSNTVPLEASGKDVVHGHVEDMEPKTDFGEVLLDDKSDSNLHTSAALPWVASSSAEEEAGSDGGYYLPLYPDFVNLNIPRRVPALNDDAYSYQLDISPRKGVPVGLNHQADIPEWNPNSNSKESICSDDIVAHEQALNLVGTSIIPMPDANFSFNDDANIGSGRNDCTCLDKDSIRCVRQHVEEARQKLRGSLGEEKFLGLGFNIMGEVVANTWTEEEEYLFHEVVYSNPVSLGKNFWKSLSAVFPSRTNMELISYYFNVFILGRRAVQNRSDFLDIDSDDDEWQGDGIHREVEGHDDDSVVESFDDEDLHVDSEIGFSLGINNHNDDHDDDDNDDDGGNDDGGDVRTDVQGDSMMGNQVEQVPPKPIEKLDKDSEVINQVNNMTKVLSSNNAQAGMYLERNSFPLIHESGGDEHTAIQENGIKSGHIKFLGGKMNGTNESLGSGFILEGCDSKAWDYAFSTSHIKGIDLLPTCNMIEEIFGPCAWNDN
ncbi:hypothetical protein Leryth_015759 [Lithospermum erythrorhizon]|nr:hypothetical protein Leryth_015759 [Lithospermum erythrorhizon]